MSSNHMQSGFAGLKLLVLLGVAVMASSGLYMSIQSAYTPNQEYSVIYYHHGLAKTNEVKAEVLGVSIAKPVQTPLPTSQIQALIDKTLQKYIDSGKFVGPQGPQGPAGQGVVQGTNFQSTAIISGTPIVSYIQAASNSNSISGNVAGFTQLSASSLSVGNTTALNNLTVTGSTLFSGTFTASSTNITSLTDSGSASFGGNVGIGTSNPQASLHITNGGLLIDTPNPTLKGSYTTAKIWGFTVVGNFAYLTNDAQQFIILDVSNPASPKLISSTSVSSWSFCVAVSGHYAYVCNGSTSTNIYDIANPSSPQLVGTLGNPGGGNGWQGSMRIAGNYLYVSYANIGIQIADISNPSSPVWVAQVPFSNPSNGFYISSNYLYVTTLSAGFNPTHSGHMLIYSVANPANPILIGEYNPGVTTEIDSVYVVGKYAYTLIKNVGLRVLDISNPASISVVTTLSSISSSNSIVGLDITINGKYAYISDDAGMQIVDISDPTNPVLINTYSAGGAVRSTLIVGRYAYASNFGVGTTQFSILDLKGADIFAANIGNILTTNLNVTDSAVLGGSVQIGNSLGVGLGGIYSGGPVSIWATSSVASALSVMGGNVGIGTSTPAGSLHIVGSFPNIIVQSTTNGGVGQFISKNASSTAFNMWEGGSAWHNNKGLLYGPGIDMFADCNNSPSDADCGQIRFYTNAFNLWADSPKVVISNSGSLGIGTTSPIGKLSITGSGTGTTADFVFADSNNVRKFVILDNGNVGIGTSTPTLGPLTMASGAYVTAGGVWTNASDRNLKENFATVTPIDILQKINQLPIPQWNYKNEDASIKHIGPIAQDFYSIFQVGNSSTSISTIDPAGVALLGIQALDQKITALQGSLNGNATTSNLTVYSPSNFSGDSVGEAKILAGATSVRVTFSQAYKYEPIVTVTPINFDGKWKLNNVDSTGFTIEYSDVQPLPSDLYFNWHSFASPNAKLTVSDGTTSAIELVVINKIQNNPVPIIVPVADENNNSTSTPKAEQVLGDATSTSTSDVTPSTPETLSTPTPVQSPETIVPPENPTP